MRRYILFNKPFGVLSQFTPEEAGQRTLAEFDLPPTVYAAGRLDRDSEGLLLLTDDGPLIKRMLEPGLGHERSYWVQVEGAIDPTALQKLEQGVRIGDYTTMPAKARRIEEPNVWERIPPIRYRAAIPTSWIDLTLIEGKNRQVRRMTAAVGFPTLRLIRHSIGRVSVDGLMPGTWRELTADEVRLLQQRPAPNTTAPRRTSARPKRLN